MPFDNYDVALLIGLALVVVLTVARVIEVVTGHHPSNALTAGFASAVSCVLVLIASARRRE